MVFFGILEILCGLFEFVLVLGFEADPAFILPGVLFIILGVFFIAWGDGWY